MILYFERVFDMLLYVFFKCKNVNLDHAREQVNYTDKLRRLFHPRNHSAIELHFVCQMKTFHRDLLSLVGVKNKR